MAHEGPESDPGLLRKDPSFDFWLHGPTIGVVSLLPLWSFGAEMRTVFTQFSEMGLRFEHLEQVALLWQISSLITLKWAMVFALWEGLVAFVWFGPRQALFDVGVVLASASMALFLLLVGKTIFFAMAGSVLTPM